MIKVERNNTGTEVVIRLDREAVRELLKDLPRIPKGTTQATARAVDKVRLGLELLR